MADCRPIIEHRTRSGTARTIPDSGGATGNGAGADPELPWQWTRGHPGPVHKTMGLRHPAAAFPLSAVHDDAADRRAANRAVAVSAIGLGATGLIELLLATADQSAPSAAKGAEELAEAVTTLL